jgi:hypothetical protein
MQPMSDGRVEGLSDVTYDLVTVLANCGEAVDALSLYIEDAKRDSDLDVQQAFEQIRSDEIRHCDTLRGLIADQAKSGKL